MLGVHSGKIVLNLMNNSQRNRTLNFLKASESIPIVSVKSYNAGWNACAQDVLDTLGDWSAALSGCGDSSKKFDVVRQELATYFAKLNDNNWIEP